MRCLCNPCSTRRALDGEHGLGQLSMRPRGLTFTWWGCYGLGLSHKLAELEHSLLFCSFVCFCFYGPFNFISFHEFFRQLSVLPVLSQLYWSFQLLCLFMKVSFSREIIPSGWLGSKHQLTNSLLPLLPLALSLPFTDRLAKITQSSLQYTSNELFHSVLRTEINEHLSKY